MDSFSGTDVRPSILVKMTVWLTPGRVNSVRSAAAAPRKELTPGITSYGMSCDLSASICSLIAPYREGSPVWSLAMVLFFLNASTMTVITSSRVMDALLCTSQPSFFKFKSPLFTREPA